MQITITGRHLTVTEPLHDYIMEKISKIGKVHDSDELRVEVAISHDRNPSIPNHDHVEITGFMRDYTIRVEEAAPDMYTAIDLASEALETQMRKFKTRILARRRHRGDVFKSAAGATEMMIDAPEPVGTVVREKKMEAQIMSEDEAILQMELLGHDFFVFMLEGTNDSAVVYKRDAGDYGMLRMG